MSPLFSFSVQEIGDRLNEPIYPESFVIEGEAACLLTRSLSQKGLLVLAPAEHPWLDLFQGKAGEWGGGLLLKRCPRNEANALALRRALPGLRPTLLGMRTSVGFGDRLGLATPGHVRALRSTDRTGKIAPIFAQQSRREMDRSGRTPGQVLAEATWGALQAGWRGPVGADADHLKTGEDIDQCAAAGFTCFTIDPGEYVDGRASQDSLPVLQGKAAGLPWERLESDLASLLQRYAGYSLDLEQQAVTLNEATALRAAVKYAGAIAHVVRLYRRLEELGQPFELEVSVDETETPTSHAEHVFIAAELKRLGVRWASLAPRFVGRFEKGVDYLSPAGKMGDLEAFAEDVQGHAGIARALGPYKLSLHSGSDKFSIYPLVQEATRGLVHLKTAGTSYLEALRIISRFEPDLFREILCLAYERYAEDRVSYNVSASLVNLPQPEMISEDRFPALMQDFTAREVLHVTFGSALAVYGPQLLAAIRTHEEAYAEGLAEHFGRHLRAFVE